METGCKLGSPDKFENHKLYSNTITQQNEREPGVVLNSRKNMVINLAFFNYLLTKTIGDKRWLPVYHVL